MSQSFSSPILGKSLSVRMSGNGEEQDERGELKPGVREYLFTLKILKYPGSVVLCPSLLQKGIDHLG